MKRILVLLLSLAMLLLVFAGCGPSDKNAPTAAPSASGAATPDNSSESAPEPSEEPVTIRLGGLTGATSMGMVKLLADADAGETQNSYDFTLAGSADELTPKLIQGELDIVAAPVNLGAVLWNNTQGAVKMLALNTLGVIYIVEKGGETVSSMADLRGMTILATGKGSTPEYALNYLLAQNGLTPSPT